MTAKQHLYTRQLVYLILFSLYIVTVEMRPGRVYYLLQTLLFRNSVAALLLYLLLFAFTTGSLLVLLFNKSKTIRYSFLLLLFPLLSISLTYRFITGYNFAYTDAQTALSNMHYLQAALSTYALPIVLALVSAALVVGALFFLSKRTTLVYQPWQAGVVVPALFLSYLYAGSTLGNADDFPAFYRVPVSTFLAHQHELPLGSRHKVAASPTTTGVKHLFMIMDESIIGSALSLNGNSAATTPYLKAAANRIINFGIASSTANYSSGSNIALMSGIQLAQLPDKKHLALTQPSIFQYASKAGYKTYFIDAQLGLKVLQNYVSPSDLAYVDHFIQPIDEDPNMPYYERDYAVAHLLLQLSKSPDKVFVYVNKAGAHWPYARTYPPNAVFFKPTLPERSMLMDHEKSRNTYYNSVRWTVDGFWKKLLTGITPRDSTVIIYTSDHGQDLSGNGIQITHASTTNTTPIEANVPLWLLDESGYTSRYTIPAPNRQAHQQIFPTLLLLQGYSSSFIHTKYGNTLFDKPASKPRSFLNGDIFARGPASLVQFDTNKKSRQ
ncbi:sulfatase-like hydrolase/transferase [Pontibacter chitinilyticus]|uniref:sulfatase-like hydrolase/transferase n=1 Tax=Pontibacter chitinilyticus TaxID=2674989 RepID=UPI00321AE855